MRTPTFYAPEPRPLPGLVTYPLTVTGSKPTEEATMAERWLARCWRVGGPECLADGIVLEFAGLPFVDPPGDAPVALFADGSYVGDDLAGGGNVLGLFAVDFAGCFDEECV